MQIELTRFTEEQEILEFTAPLELEGDMKWSDLTYEQQVSKLAEFFAHCAKMLVGHLENLPWDHDDLSLDGGVLMTEDDRLFLKIDIEEE